MSYNGVYYGATLRNGIPQYGQYNLTLANDLLTLSISYSDGSSCSVSGKSRIDFTGYLRVDGAAGSCAFCTNFKVDATVCGALWAYSTPTRRRQDVRIPYHSWRFETIKRFDGFPGVLEKGEKGVRLDLL